MWSQVGRLASSAKTLHRILYPERMRPMATHFWSNCRAECVVWVVFFRRLLMKSVCCKMYRSGLHTCGVAQIW